MANDVCFKEPSLEDLLRDDMVRMLFASAGTNAERYRAELAQIARLRAKALGCANTLPAGAMQHAPCS